MRTVIRLQEFLGLRTDTSLSSPNQSMVYDLLIQLRAMGRGK